MEGGTAWCGGGGGQILLLAARGGGGGSKRSRCQQLGSVLLWCRTAAHDLKECQAMHMLQCCDKHQAKTYTVQA
jgi:hypothetical protein